MIETVKVLRTLKAGSTIWHKGEIIGPPVPDDLLSEIRRGFVEVLRESSPTPAKVESEEVTTFTSQGTTLRTGNTLRRRKRK